MYLTFASKGSNNPLSGSITYTNILDNFKTCCHIQRLRKIKSALKNTARKPNFPIDTNSFPAPTQSSLVLFCLYLNI